MGMAMTRKRARPLALPIKAAARLLSVRRALKTAGTAVAAEIVVTARNTISSRRCRRGAIIPPARIISTSNCR